MVKKKEHKDLILIGIILIRIFFCYLHHGKHDLKYWYSLENCLKAWDYTLIPLLILIPFKRNIYSLTAIFFCLSLATIQILSIPIAMPILLMNCYCIIFGLISIFLLIKWSIDD